MAFRFGVDHPIFYLNANNLASYPGSGTSWYDLTYRKTNITLVNGPTFATNPGAISFDGVDDYASTNGSLFKRVDGESMTVGVWIKPALVSPTLVAQDIVVSRESSSGGYNWMLAQFADRKIGFHGIGQLVGTYIPTPNVWLNVVVTISWSAGSGTCRIYINGVLQDTFTNFTYGTSVSDVTDSFCIGNGRQLNQLKEPFQGLISSVIIYLVALSPDQILAQYNSTKSVYGL